MKQSKKLLSLVLAVVMMFGVFSVGANAALVKSEVNYDAIDNAALTDEQVADLALDAVDQLLAQQNIKMDLSILGSIDLTSCDNAASSIYKLINNNKIILWMAGDANNLNVSAFKDLKRSGGDLNFIYKLIQFLNDNSKVIVKAIGGGIATSDGISLGVANSFIKVGSLNDTLKDIPGMLNKMVFDALLYGSYGYPTKSADLGSLPSTANDIDKILNVAAKQFLEVPQNYTWVGEGEDSVKTWDENSIVSRLYKANPVDINVNTHTVFQLLDSLINMAYDEFGPTVLNNDAKKLLMQATGVDFVKLDNEKDASLIAAIKADSQYVDVAASGLRGTETYVETNATLQSVKNYLCDAQMWKVGGVWYFRDYVDVVQKDAEGNDLVDEDGNKITAKEDRFFKANVSGANEFYDIVNWDYKFVPGDIDFAAMISENGSVFGSLNSLLYKVLVKAVNSDVLDVNTVWTDGDNSHLNANLLNTAKYVLKNYTRRIFGKNSEFVDPANGYKATAAFAQKVDSSSLIELIEYIGLPFFGDAMPQLILPEDGLQSVAPAQKLFAFGAAVIREFMTQIAANRNYDSFIYTDLTSATGRKFVSHTSEEWLNLILNMGMDIGYTYLSKGVANFTGEMPAEGVSASRWQDMLNEVIAWGIDYVGSNDSSVLVGLEGSKFSAYTDPLDKLSYALNTILPLGFISGCESDNFAFDLKLFLNNVIVPFVESFDVETLLTLFGRSNTKYNILRDENVVKVILDLANSILKLVIGKNLLPTTASCGALLTNANLKTVVTNLLSGLNDRKVPLLTNALPVVAQFISAWGGEQTMGTPKTTLSSTVTLNNGAISDAVIKVSNGSQGVWRHYTDASGNGAQDEQYKYKITGVSVKDINGNTVSNMTISSYPQGILDYGQSGEIKYSVSGVGTSGMVVRLDVDYIVYDEDGNTMLNGTVFTTSKYTYLSYNGTNSGSEHLTTDKHDVKPYVFSPYYIAFEDGADAIPRLNTFRLKNTNGTFGRTGSFPTITGGTQRGITLNPWTKDGGTGNSKSNGISVSKDSSEYAQKFTVNKDQYNASTFAPGDSLSWNATGYSYAGTGSGKASGTATITLRFYSSDALKDVKNIANTEAGKFRKASDYATGDVLATALLTSEDSVDSKGNAVLRESNFAATGVNGDGETVTKINGTEAWNNYVEAFNVALRSAYQVWNDNSVYNQKEAYEALKVAAADLDQCKLTPQEIAAAGGTNNDSAVVALKNTLKATEAGFGGKSFFDYKIYRWSRWEKAYKNANNIIKKYEAAKYTVAETQYFPYNQGYKVTDINSMISGNQYEAYIKALYKNYSAEQIAANEKNLDNARSNYAGVSALDIAQASNLVTRQAARLLERDAYTKNQHLQTEVASALAQIGTTNTKGYTEKSWNRYMAALQGAQEALSSSNCDTIFDQKYELQVARNELRTEEADDTELKALIAQAQAALAGAAAYDNTNAEFGAVLAALGMAKVTDADGNKVDLFPNGALNIVNKSYDVDDQRKYDRAADALRAALAKLTFKGATVAGASETKVGEDEDGNAVTVKAAVIDQKLAADAVKGLFTLAAADDKVVSLNGTYALSGDDTAIYTGTGSTLTFVKTVNGVALPVYTLSLVVKGDINGDGVVDALDAMAVELAANNNASLNGLFFAAGDVTNDGAIAVADYSAVVNTAVRG